uniref:Type II toxin-antitoxin system HipA family toxin n=1 Tax=mine drainage metagenome TaxID=410659 RepID=E6QX18_9ZZZZ
MTDADKLKSNSSKPRTRNTGPKILVKANIHLWNEVVGAVMEYENGRIGFSYNSEYIRNGGLAISPKFLPIESRTFEFPDLQRQEAFMGLPGVLADSLPDTFGNLIIKKYFEERGELDKSLSPVQRLLYVGNRAMGALEYAPHLQRRSPEEEQSLEIKSLVESARRLIEGETGEAIHEIMRVGGSAGGARPKALILWDREKNKVRSGFAKHRAGEEHWMIKFDGVNSANERDNKAKPFNRIEYSYALLVKQLGIDMEEVSYLADGELFHFMTRRFDRKQTARHHMHSLAGMTHVDYNLPGAYSYEAWLRLIQELHLGYPAMEQAYRRMIFNVVGRNQDDHVKNISFLVKDKSSGWELAPAYDLTYSAGVGYTRQHQMTVAGHADEFIREELIAIGKKFAIHHPEMIINETVDAFSKWPALAQQWGVQAEERTRVVAGHRLYLA